MRKILVVEDTAPNRILMARMVETLGHIPVLASDGARALAILEDNPDISCVVTDCQMPVLDGPAMVREIRTRWGDRIPVIMYSAFIGVKDIRELLEMGATRFLNHPVNRPALAEAIHGVLP